jgi:NADPH:quinone reductase-like Zn-dependent oxidoreductase
MAKRIRIYKKGGRDRLTIEDFDCPEPKEGEIKINVKAAGINFADVCVRQGLYSSANEFVGFPITPGFEVAGTVAATGKGVKAMRPGDRVLAGVFFGGYSSEVIAKAQYVRKLPADLSFTQAASVLAVFATSYHASHWLPRIHPGSTALVHSVAGGVGLSLTQMLKDLDCKVVGVVGSSHKTKISKEYGVDVVIDKSTVDLWSAAEKESPGGYDLIYDPNGISTFKQSYDHLAQCGTLFVYGFQSMLSKTNGHQNLLVLIRDYLRTPRFSPFNMVKTNKSVTGFNISYLFERQDILGEGLDFTMRKLADKTFRSLPVTAYPFEDVAKAHQDIESGKTTGKLVLTF